MRQVNLLENRFALRETGDKRGAHKETNAEILLQRLAPTKRFERNRIETTNLIRACNKWQHNL